MATALDGGVTMRARRDERSEGGSKSTRGVMVAGFSRQKLRPGRRQGPDREVEGRSRSGEPIGRYRTQCRP